MGNEISRLFNIYYINYQKVYEIKMMVTNIFRKGHCHSMLFL